MNRSELPYETYERLTGKKWTGGRSASVKSLLSQYGITAPLGSEQANNALQRALKADKTLTGSRPSLPESKGITPGRIPEVGSAVERGYQAMKGNPQGESKIEQFRPEDFQLIQDALKAAGVIGVGGAALGSAAGLTGIAAGEAGLASMAPEVAEALTAMKEAAIAGNRARLVKAVQDFERVAPNLRGRALAAARRGADEAKSALSRSLRFD